MMKKTNKARQVSVPLLRDILGTITPMEQEKTRVEMELAARIADWMGERGMSKSGLAAKVAKQPSEVTKWLSGTHNFTVSTLVEICEALEIKIEELFQSKHPPVIQVLRFMINASQRPPIGNRGFGEFVSKAKSHRTLEADLHFSPAINFG